LKTTDEKIYKAILALLKKGLPISQASISRESGLHRKTIYNKVKNNSLII